MRNLLLPAALAAFAFAAGPAQAEMKSQWVEYSHGDTKLNNFLFDTRTGKAVSLIEIGRAHV